MFIYPYKAGSGSVARLKEKMLESDVNLRVIRRENSRFKGNENKTVINWGASSMPEEVMKADLINKPEAVAIAADKIKFFEVMKDKVSIPEHTTDYDTALGWLEEGCTILARSTLTGHSGQGISVVEAGDDLSVYRPSTKMYVKYIPKKEEYRIHVVGGEVVDMARKAKPHHLDADQTNWKVRTHSNGFVFVREDCNPHEDVLTEAVKAVEECGLDFGAVDIIWNDYRKKPFVLEVNTAPGIEGQTLDTYADHLKKMQNSFAERYRLKAKRTAQNPTIIADLLQAADALF